MRDLCIRGPKDHTFKDWYDGFIEQADNMNIYLISDTHLNHANIATYCDRPKNFTELIMERWNQTVKPEDTIIHLGDVILHKKSVIKDILDSLNGRKFRQCWLTHEPAQSLAEGCILNIHGHLHNIWHGFHTEGGVPQVKLHNPWQRLFAIEYTNYAPVEFDKFVDRPNKYLARGIPIVKDNS